MPTSESASFAFFTQILENPEIYLYIGKKKEEG